MGIYKCVREAAPVLKTGQKAKAAFYQSVFVLEGQIWAHTMIRGWSYSPSEDYGDECRDWKWSWSQIRLILFLHQLYCVRSHNQNITFRSVSYTVSITKHHSDSWQYKAYTLWESEWITEYRSWTNDFCVRTKAFLFKILISYQRITADVSVISDHLHTHQSLMRNRAIGKLTAAKTHRDSHQ